MRLLREFISNCVFERIRAQVDSTGQFFKLNVFKNLTDNVEFLNYAKDKLKFLGKGSARIVYLLSSQKVLKIALNNKGLGQNEAEVSVYTNPKTKNIIAKIYDYDPNFNWLISDAVREINDDEFNSWFDLKDTTYSSVEFLEEITDNNNTPEEVIENFCDPDTKKTKQILEFIVSLRSMWEINGLLPGDLSIVSHFGKTRDGRLVLLDYGFTDDVYQKHYQRWR